MLRKLPISKFEWIEDTSKFVEDFIKSYNEESNKGYFLEVYFNILKNYKERMKIKKSKSLLLT